MSERQYPTPLADFERKVLHGSIEDIEARDFYQARRDVDAIYAVFISRLEAQAARLKLPRVLLPKIERTPHGIERSLPPGDRV